MLTMQIGNIIAIDNEWYSSATNKSFKGMSVFITEDTYLCVYDFRSKGANRATYPLLIILLRFEDCLISKGPQQFMPTFSKTRAGITQSLSKEPISCLEVYALCLQQVTYLYIKLNTSLKLFIVL